MRGAVLALVCTLAAAVPCVAVAAPRHTPPGNSAVDEYSETVPGPGGDRPVPRTGPAFPGPGAVGVVGGTAGSRALRGLGADGRAVEQFASHTGPRGALTGRPLAAPDVGRRGLVEQILDALTGGGEGGMGLLLPLLLLAALAGMILAALRRRRAEQA